MFAYYLPQELIQYNHPQWTFGDAYFTHRVAEMINAKASIDSMFTRIIGGNYGLISTDKNDHAITAEARNSGRRFVAVFEEPQGIFYIALNENGRTIVCEFSER